MIRGDDADGIDVVAHLVEHDAKVGELLHFGIFLEILLDVSCVEINVAKGHRLGKTTLANSGDNAGGASTDADASEIDALARRHVAFVVGLAEGKVGRHDRESESSGSGFFKKETASRIRGR